MKVHQRKNTRWNGIVRRLKMFLMSKKKDTIKIKMERKVEPWQ